MQISDREVMNVQDFNFALKVSAKWGTFSSKFCIFGSKVLDKQRCRGTIPLAGIGGIAPITLNSHYDSNDATLVS